MPIHVGSTSFGALKVGDSNIDKVYVGDTLVFSTAVYNLTLTLTENVANAHLEDSDGNTISQVVIPESTSVTVFLVPDTGYQYTASPQGTVSTGTNYTYKNNGLDSGRLSITFTANDLSADVSETASIGFQAPTKIPVPASGTITYSFNTGVQNSTLPTTYSGNEGETFEWSGNVAAQSEYTLNGSAAASGSFVIPVGGGNVNQSVSNTATLNTYSGALVFSVASNVQAVANQSYSNQAANSTVNWSVTLMAQPGYTFSGGDEEMEVSGSVSVPSGGGNIPVDLTGHTVTQKNTISISSNDFNVGHETVATFTINFTQTGSAVPTFEGPTWVNHTGTLTNTSTSTTFTVDENDGAERSGTIRLRKTATVSDTVGITQDPGPLPATSGTIAPDPIQFTLGNTGTVQVTVTTNTNGQWNITGGGNNLTWGQQVGTGSATFNLTYNGANNAKDGTITLRSGLTIGAGTVLDTVDLLF